MNIGKISSLQFNGAYFVRGDAKRVREFEEQLSDYKEKLTRDQKNKPEAIISEVVGNEYTSCDMPACLLVVTGSNDIKAYNKFVQKMARKAEDDKDSAESPVKEKPKQPKAKKSGDGFSRIEALILNNINSYTKAVEDKCNFKNKPDTVDAGDALKAIRLGRFDYQNGKIKDGNKNDYQNGGIQKRR